MKKIVASVGLVALGATSINALHAQDIKSAPTKSWNVSASLRGFYDDNVNTMSGANKNDSVGFELKPMVSLNWANDQTSVKAGYSYALKYYSDGPYDVGWYDTTDYTQNHKFDLGLNHNFNERYRVYLGEAFVLGQEPDQLRGRAGASDLPQQVPGNNIRNFATVVFNAQVSQLIGVEAAYANDYVNYDSTFLSGLLDRMGHSLRLEGIWQMSPETAVFLGYEYAFESYTADQVIYWGLPPFIPDLMSDDRDNRSHYIYVGADHVFRPDLSGSARAGVRLTDYINADSNDTTPYARASLRYTYTTESYAEIGINYDRVATDVLSPIPGVDFTKDKQAFLFFGSVNHRFTSKISGSLVGQLQSSTFNGGLLDGETELYYMLGLNVRYRFNPHYLVEAGYNYDSLNSDAAGYDYDRNRIYLGVTATY
jgi:hypothetical protein